MLMLLLRLYQAEQGMIQIEWFTHADNSVCCNFGKRSVGTKQEKWDILELFHDLKSSIEFQTIHVR